MMEFLAAPPSERTFSATALNAWSKLLTVIYPSQKGATVEPSANAVAADYQAVAYNSAVSALEVLPCFVFSRLMCASNFLAGKGLLRKKPCSASH
jgi:hypothetical protein